MLNYVDQAVQTDVPAGAYTHSLEVPSPSTPASCRPAKHPQLLYSCPIESHLPAKRVVSLPESLFDGSCDLPRVAHDAPKIRVVSLPETMPWLPHLTDKNAYLDGFGTSTDTSHTSSGIDSGHHKSRAYSKLDIPRTPSPPSSPESVLIIDNDIHLSSLFLYRHSHNSTANEDDGGAYPQYLRF